MAAPAMTPRPFPTATANQGTAKVPAMSQRTIRTATMTGRSA